MTTPVSARPTTTSQESAVPQVAAVNAVLAAAEGAIITYMIGAYTKWLAQVVTKVLGGFARFGVAPDPGAIWATVPLWEGFVDELMDRLKQLARAGWITTGTQLGIELPWNPDDPMLADSLARTRNLLVRTPDEVYRQILKTLGESVATGDTVEDQVRKVRHVLDVTGTENWPSRARTVAVTEVHRAWNMGALAASMRAQQQLASPLDKRWSARDDTATRPAHNRADGQTVPINQPFIVNMEPLMFPGDPSGSPGNVINCRCKPLFSRRER